MTRRRSMAVAAKQVDRAGGDERAGERGRREQHPATQHPVQPVLLPDRVERVFNPQIGGMVGELGHAISRMKYRVKTGMLRRK